MNPNFQPGEQVMSLWPQFPATTWGLVTVIAHRPGNPDVYFIRRPNGEIHDLHYSFLQRLDNQILASLGNKARGASAWMPPGNAHSGGRKKSRRNRRRTSRRRRSTRKQGNALALTGGAEGQGGFHIGQRVQAKAGLANWGHGTIIDLITRPNRNPHRPPTVIATIRLDNDPNGRPKTLFTTLIRPVNNNNMEVNIMEINNQ